MNKWFKRNYRLISGLCLVLVFVGWTAFVNSSDTRQSKVFASTANKEAGTKAAESVSAVTTEQIAAPDEEQTEVIAAEPIAVLADNSETVPAEKFVDEPAIEVDVEIPDVPVDEPAVEEPLVEEPAVEPVDGTTEEPDDTYIEPIAEPVAEYAITFPYAIANVVGKLNIRSGPGPEYSVVGYMQPNGHCEVLEWGAEWTKIKSGNITGYSSTEFLLFNEACIEKLQLLNRLLIKVTSNTLNIRSMPNTECKVLDKAYNGHKYMYLPDKSVEGWYCIQYSEIEVGYMTAEFSVVYIDTPTAIAVK